MSEPQPFVLEITTKIPEQMHKDADFKTLYGIVIMERMTSKEQTVAYFDGQIAAIEEWLRGNQAAGGSLVLQIRNKIVKMETYKTCRKMCLTYL